MKTNAVLWVLMFCAQLLWADRSKQALRAIEKEEFEKAEAYLERSYEKDTLNPLVFYAYAQLYVAEAYDNRDVDVAHDYILHAIDLLPDRTEDHSDEIDKADLTPDDFDGAKTRIDSVAYGRARERDELTAYAFFISHYSDAVEVPEAKTRRDELAFAAAERQGDWQAYEDFIKQYPDAAQYLIAKRRFETLAYEAKTRSNALAELEDFLIEFPNTPYRSVVEQKIYDKRVAGLEEGQILEFINSYHNNKLTRRALGLLYHTVGLDASKLKPFNQQVYQQFMDSVARLELLNQQVLYPFYFEGEYAFYDVDGNEFLGGPYEDISLDYLCGNVTEQILEVKQNNVFSLINREGTVIYQGFIDSYKDLGSGVLCISENGMKGAIYKTGDVILPNRYEEVTVLNQQLVAFRENGKMGLVSITGEIYLDPAYDDIYMEGPFWVVEQDGVFGVTNLHQILTNEKKIDLKYEEVELINDKHIVGYTSDYETLLDEHLRVLSPDSSVSINTVYETWTFRTAQGYYIYDQQDDQLTEAVYDDVLQNYEWLGLRQAEKWAVYNKNIHDEPILNVDSVKLIGEDMVIVFRDNQGMAIFPNKKVIDVQEGEYIQALSSSRRLGVHYLVIKRNGKQYLYGDGELLFAESYDELGFIADSVFSVKRDGQYGAVDEKGRPIMRVRYDAIMEAKDGVADVLYRGKFGAYNFTERILLNLEYEEKIRVYSDALYVVKTEGGYGILDDHNHTLVEGRYDQIVYWTDSAFLAQEEGRWLVRNVYDELVHIDRIDGYDFLSKVAGGQTIEIRVDNLYGVYHSTLGLVIPPVFNDIYNLGSAEKNIYFAEKRFAEADYYVVVYYDYAGNKIRSEAYRGNEYELIVCED
ncbi:WG repeat-containing protein [Reichenbachiella sp. 5M10]|uniref:WG repeat-containing protein n=1 Tax=Reichenbachiella sp. 5M10 TaxID=1889772 RepID=UPI0013042892|nr:WG repeat-containing protein [Reichenbachiella sp. 5M10]